MLAFDPVPFLRETLEDVWNGKLPGRLYERAAATLTFHGPSGRSLYGREEAIAEVIGWLAAFPDTRLAIEDVICCGDERRGWLLSVRYRRSGANRGVSIYGPATGRAVSLGGICHVFVQGGLIREIWQECDELALVEQLGLDVSATLERLAEQRWPASAEPFGLGEVRRGLGQLAPAPLPSVASSEFDVEDFVRRSLHDIWNRRLVGRIEQVYHPALRWQLGDRAPGGRDDLAAHVLARLAALPDLALYVDQLIWQGNETAVTRAAIAWTLLATDGGRVRLHGLTQQYIEAGRITAEWTHCGELAHMSATPSGRMRNEIRHEPD